MRLVLWQGLKMTIAGVSVGVVAGLAAGQALEHLVGGMQPISGATFAVMIPLLTSVALLASFIPARRASLVDPVKALRQE
jgi:putative ABC transport system permease protein